MGAVRDGDLPDYDRLVERLTAGLPESGDHALVHGDFRLDNIARSPLGQPPAIEAVVDWEMSRRSAIRWPTWA